MSKIPFLITLSFLAIPLLDGLYALRAKKLVATGIGLSLICVAWWYYYWWPFLIRHYGNQLTWPVSFEEGWRIVMEKRAQESLLTLLGAPFYYKIPFLFSMMGLGLIWTGKDRKLILFTLIYAVMFFVFALKSGVVFPTHEYYSIPLIPLLALLFGFFFSQLQCKSGYSMALAGVLLIPCHLHNREKSFTPQSNRAYLMGLGNILDRYTNPKDKIMVNDGAFSPAIMYWAKRKGWTVNQDVPSKTGWMPGFQQQGLKYILMDRHLSDEALPYTLLYEDNNFRLYGFQTEAVQLTK